MRTTLDIDDDLIIAVKELAKREKTTIGKVVSRLILESLASDTKKPRKITYRNGIPILPSRGVIVTNELIDQIRDEEGI